MASSRVRLFLAAGALVCGAALGAVYFGLNALVQAGIERFVPRATKARVEIAGVSVSPWSGTGSLSGVVLGNPEGFRSDSALRVRKVRIEVVPRSLVSDTIRVRRVELVSPVITYELASGGSNIDRIVKNVRKLGRTTGGGASKGASGGDAGSGGGSGRPPGGGAGRKVVIEEFIVTGAQVRLAAKILRGEAVTLSLPEIRLKNLGSEREGGAAGAAEAIARAIQQAVVKAVGSPGTVLNEPVGTFTGILRNILKGKRR